MANIREIPFPNAGGPTPDGTEPRVETGAVRFGSDWPGLFIRGDEAHNLALGISSMDTYLKQVLRSDQLDAIRHLRIMTELCELRDTIIRDVVQK